MSYLQKCHWYISSSARRSTRRRSRRRSSTSVSTRRADKPRPSCSHARPYPCGVVSVFAIPFLPRAHAEPSSSSGHRRRPRRPSSPPCLDSPRPEPHNLSLGLPHPFPSSFEPTPGRIDLQSSCVTGRHCLAAPELRPSVAPLPPVHLRSIRGHGEHPCAVLFLPNPIPARIPHRRSRSAAAPPRMACCAAGARRGPPLYEATGRCRAPRGRRAPLAVAPPLPAVLLPRHGRNSAATARRRKPPPLPLRAAVAYSASCLRGPQLRWPLRVGRPRRPGWPPGPSPAAERAPSTPPVRGRSRAGELSPFLSPLCHRQVGPAVQCERGGD